MRIVKEEKIYLSQNEADVWLNFHRILEAIERGSENPNTIKLALEIECSLADLWQKIEEVE